MGQLYRELSRFNSEGEPLEAVVVSSVASEQAQNSRGGGGGC
jgi:hypothetical protein